MQNENENPCLPEITDADLSKITFLSPPVFLYQKRSLLAKLVMLYPNFIASILSGLGLKIVSDKGKIKKGCGC